MRKVSEQMRGKLPSFVQQLPGTLTFVAGVAVGGFMNMFTSLESELIGWRLAAMLSFLAAAALLFASAGMLQRALRDVELLSSPVRGDQLPELWRSLGRDGAITMVVGAVAALAAVAILVLATVSNKGTA